jgi:hypothetical protein
MIKEITLKNIRDEILKYYPELLWWDGKNKHETFNPIHSYKHRQGMPNEIRIEFDFEDLNRSFIAINMTSINLYNAGYSFAVFYVEGGRSPHIYIYDLDELETLDYDDRTEFRKQFLKKYCSDDADEGLCDEKHLCALEFAMHFKYNRDSANWNRKMDRRQTVKIS